MNLSRINLRLKFRDITFFTMIARTQTAAGITSQIEFDNHIVMWDLDNCTLEEAKGNLKRVQFKYNLSDIYIISDKKGSYRALCFTQVKFIELLRILVDTEGVDEGFIGYTARKFHACIRLSTKQDRPKQRTVAILRSYKVPLPNNINIKVYDTNTTKHEVTVDVH